MPEFFAPVLDAFSGLLGSLANLFEPIFPGAGWGWAIIALTLIVRIALLPLAIKQTRSMRAMTALQPMVKEIQEKHKADRDLMRRDPDKYKARKQKQNEELMALYQREGVNPAASCLPLLAQAPIFLALFWTLQGEQALDRAEFYFFTAVGDGGLRMTITQAGWPGWLLIVIMSGTLFWSQKQMMARNAANSNGDNPMAQQQKVLLYVMPVFLAVISFQFPVGVVLYWATTNLWQVAQQAIILREVKQEVEAGQLGRGTKQSEERRSSPGASSGRRSADPTARAADATADDDDDDDDEDGPAARGDASTGEPPSGPPRPRLPRRGGGGR